MQTRRKIYVACGLTHAPQEFRDKICGLMNELDKEYEVLRWSGLTEGNSADVYHHDIRVCVTSCDAVLAICDEPATGLGWELAYAVELLKKPVLALMRGDLYLTRLVTGAAEYHPCLTVQRYLHFKDIPLLFRIWLKQL